MSFGFIKLAESETNNNPKKIFSLVGKKNHKKFICNFIGKVN